MGNPLASTAPTAEVRMVESDAIKSQKALIVRTMQQLAEAKSKQKAIKEQITDQLEKDAQYSNIAEQVGTLKDNLKREEQRVKNTPMVSDMSVHLMESKEEVKELQTSLENHLYAYEAATGKTVIETDDGKKIFLVKKVKLASGQLSLFDPER